MRSSAEAQDAWANGASYERYMGRWSRRVARSFVDWLAVPPGHKWLDVGCGTGGLSGMILAAASPAVVRGVDRSAGYVAFARRHIVDTRAAFAVASAHDLPVAAATCDAAVSGLVLNFVPEPLRMVTEMSRAVRPNGVVALYVWDYAGKMELLRYFWDAAAALDPSAQHSDEGVRFPICQPGPLAALWREAGLAHVETRAIDIPADFAGFNDYWSPYLRGEGPAPGYAMSLNRANRTALRERLRDALPVQPDGSIHLTVRAWAVCGLNMGR